MSRVVQSPSKSPWFEKTVEDAAAALVSSIRAGKAQLPAVQTEEDFDRWISNRTKTSHLEELAAKAGEVRGAMHHCEWALAKRKFVDPKEEQTLIDTHEALKAHHKKLMARAGLLIEKAMLEK